jgi:hypothetical protein
VGPLSAATVLCIKGSGSRICKRKSRNELHYALYLAAQQCALATRRLPEGKKKNGMEGSGCCANSRQRLHTALCAVLGCCNSRQP